MKKNSKSVSEIVEREPIPEELEESVKRNMTAFAQASFVDRYPDVRDGLKPVARRVIYAMLRCGLTTSGSTIKCAKIVGDTIGTYHPHGDSSAYGVLCALAQPFTNNYPIVYGQGNFGNALGDAPAAYRYTECRFAKYSPILTRDLNDNVVEYMPNFDRREMEPTVLPAIIPNILINGNYTIGGAAFNSSIPSHNLKDVCNLVIEFIKNPDMSREDVGKRLMPDFPCGGVIINPEQVRDYYTKGIPASVKMCGKWYIDTDHNEIHITELPYLVDGNQLSAEIKKKHPKLREIGIDIITTDADRDSQSIDMDVTISYVKGTDPYKLIELLKSETKLVSTSQLMFTCVIGGKLMVDCTIKDMLSEWLHFRRSVVRKTLIKNIQESYRKSHILEAKIRVYDVLKQIVDYIAGLNEKDVVPYLMQTYGFTILQAEAIANIKVKEMSKDSKETLINQHDELIAEMNGYRAKLNDAAIDQIIIDEQLQAIKEFGRPRRTELAFQYGADIQDNTPGVDTVVSLNGGASLSVIRSKFLVDGFSGKSLAVVKNENFHRKLYRYNTKDDELFAISNLGYIYKVDLIKSFIESATMEQPKFANLQLKISPRLGEEIMELLPIPKSRIEDGTGLLLVINRGGNIKRMSVTNVPTRIQKNGTKFIPVVEGDPTYLLSCIRFFNAKETDLVMYVTTAAQYHLYPLSQLASAGKVSTGASATPSQFPIVDVIVVGDNDMVCTVSGDGSYTCKRINQLSQKRRGSNPGKLDGRMTGKTPTKSVVGLSRLTSKGVLITDSNGWFKVADLNSAMMIELTDKTDSCIEL